MASNFELKLFKKFEVCSDWEFKQWCLNFCIDIIEKETTEVEWRGPTKRPAALLYKGTLENWVNSTETGAIFTYSYSGFTVLLVFE